MSLQCLSCDECFPLQKLCKCQNCQICRKKNENCVHCCNHITKERCDHGACLDRCIAQNRYYGYGKKCPCFEEKSRDRERDYNLRKRSSDINYKDFSDTEIEEEEFSSSDMEVEEKDCFHFENTLPFNETDTNVNKLHPPFPISFDRQNFQHLDEKKWLKFQCILVWDYCCDHELNMSPLKDIFLLFSKLPRSKNFFILQWRK